jgi:hypothetical protein
MRRFSIVIFATVLAMASVAPGATAQPRDTWSCGDFEYQDDAQAVLELTLQFARSDVHRLDADNDGKACEAHRARPSPRFRDVTGTAHATAINAVAAVRLARGYPDGTYRPGANITRGQMATHLAAALGRTTPTGTFNDIAGHTHEANIRAIADLIQGYRDGSYRPNAIVTRAQMATFLAQALQLQAVPAQDRFTDVAGDAHRDNIQRVAAAGIALGHADATYRPRANMRRGQMASFIGRAWIARVHRLHEEIPRPPAPPEPPVDPAPPEPTAPTVTAAEVECRAFAGPWEHWSERSYQAYWTGHVEMAEVGSDSVEITAMDRNYTASVIGVGISTYRAWEDPPLREDDDFPWGHEGFFECFNQERGGQRGTDTEWWWFKMVFLDLDEADRLQLTGVENPQ